MIVAAALWGFAEATLFFVVPDVLLTFMAMRHGWRRAILLSLAAAAGAAAGGVLMYRWGAADAAAARAVADRLPAISPGMIEGVRQSLAADGLRAMVEGAFRGIPYKLYAIEAGAAKIDMRDFLAFTFAGRLARFVTVATITTLVLRALGRWLSRRAAETLLAAIWIVFYAAYWAAMPN